MVNMCGTETIHETNNGLIYPLTFYPICQGWTTIQWDVAMPRYIIQAHFPPGKK